MSWSDPNSWDSVYSFQNMDSYVSTLKSVFPDDYFFVTIAASNLAPNKVPSVITKRFLADGIGESSITGIGVPNLCRYAISGNVIDGALAVLDHEIGHNWGTFIGSELALGHWHSNSTMSGQMSEVYSDDGGSTVKQIVGDPVSGFSWIAVDNLVRNETDVFTEQDLYLQGLASSFPAVHVLSSPIYNADHTVSYSSVATYDQAWVEQRNGVRSPSYQTSEKKHRVGFIYVARDLAEIQAVYKPFERSINHFVNAEQVSAGFRFQVPYLVETQFRGSVNALLADLDGNSTPSLQITSPTYLTSTDGSATVNFLVSDPDGTQPVVSCVPATSACIANNNQILLSGLTPGTHFFTIKAEDTGGKKAFEHFVVDVQ